MKFCILLLVLVAHSATGQIASPKNSVHVSPTMLDTTAASFISNKLDSEIVAIRLITILPSTFEITHHTDSTLPAGKVSVYTFHSAFSDSGTVEYERLKSQATLRYKDQQQLFEQLYGISGPSSAGDTCYRPHHGVEFLDRTGKAVGFIELCFECEKNTATPGFETGTMDSSAYKKLRSLFVQYLGPEFTAYDTQP